MLNELYYSSPACTIVEVRSEGILCGSVSEVEETSTEVFGNLKDFGW